MATLNEGQYPGEFIISEGNGSISRESVTVTVAAATTLAPGHVLAELSATSKYVEYDNAGTDGSEAAAAVLYNELDNSAGDAPLDFANVAVIVREAEVRKSDLQWNSGVDASGKTAAYADLAANHLIARD